MAAKRPCPFCSSSSATLMWSETSTQRMACVRCDHCAAEGSHMMDLPLSYGTYETTKRKLEASAWAAWNGEHQ